MSKRSICFFNLAANFHPFFMHLCEPLRKRGFEGRFFNFWPNELESLRINGFQDRVMDWKKDFLKEQVEVDGEVLQEWINLDPRYLSAGDERRVRLREEYRDAANYLIPCFRRMIERYDLSAVFLWNGYRFPEPIFLHVCREMGVPVLFGENGFFGHTMQIDPDGINAACSLRNRPAEDWFQTDPTKETRFEEFLACGGNLPPAGTPLPAIRTVGKAERVRSLLDPYLKERTIYNFLPRKSPFQGALDNKRIASVKANRPSSRDTQLPKNYLFLPFQVHDDTQIVIHSPWVPSMEDMIKVVLQAKKNVDLKQEVVVKEHPVDVGRSDYTKLASQVPATWLWDYPLDVAMKGADAVITVNSSVGVESVVRGKPLITLGNAIYNIEGVCYHARNGEELERHLTTALNEKPDEERRHRFLHQLRFHDMVDASWGKPTDSGVENAAERIAALLG